MRQRCVVFTIVFGLLLSPRAALAQSSQDSSGIPRVINITGVFRPADGQPAGAVESVTLSIYADQEGGTPLWQETQQVTLDERGRYTVLLGSAHADGIPPAVLASGAQWLGTVFERAGEVEGPRVRLTSVPYALRAADADTLGGRPASDYVLATASDLPAVTSRQDSSVSAPAAELPGTAGAVAKYVDASNVGPSAIVETGGLVGIGTTTPLDFLHVRYTNTNGGATGLAVQNMGNTATSYSGMLFYDQNGALGQFQGFNNVTHEYRINNIAKNGASVFDGSINFMTGSTSRFLVASNGNIGIGTTTPAANLEVSNALGATPFTNVFATTYANSGAGAAFFGRKARGTPAAPTAVQNGDNLGVFRGFGFGATTFGTGGASIAMRAAENWTDTAQGTAMHFMTTPFGTTTPLQRMTLDPFGNLGLGTSGPLAALDMVRESGAGPLEINLTRYAGTSTSGEPNIVLLTARGTRAAPSAVQAGDELGGFSAGGYGATGFGNGGVGLGGIAAENWTDTAQGAALMFGATPLGSNEGEVNMVLMPGGNLGIGVFTDFPTITDKLQVFGDIRVGTTGTNGCIKNFAGTGLIGTCSSDRRLKKDITPFAPALDKLTALQPVNYFWRANEFPDRHFGNSLNYGLIAQDVEQILPELVATDTDGYKAVDYSKLPLLTIQAVKELKAENDTLKKELKAENAALKAENDLLKDRLSEIERALTEMRTAPGATSRK